ncbi:uncharacterized protein LOC110976781 isoform X2 [Acanthaster planci]|uniref:Uncharacterized protein LOC110976781 isoform X2 n=1 Tax=Acanthaster planci TaxID=133434 RepID=A0A8B7Y296_ACAPL|nr:uncharacterized protein LOC110976781 isoform X2 [Acanthaster planci]
MLELEHGAIKNGLLASWTTMRIIILAGGYGTRLQRDLRNHDPQGVYRHLQGMPKALLPIGHRPLISHWMETLWKCRSQIDEIYVVCNDFYFKMFEDWAKDWEEAVLFNDGTGTNETRLGAVACIYLPVDRIGFEDDVTVIGGDTLFKDDFDLASVWQEFRRRQQQTPDASLVLACPCTDEDTVKVGILETDDKRVTAFLEKPGPSQTTSRKSCPCFYVLSKASLPLIEQYLEERKEGPVEGRDATGNFIQYLYPRLPVYTYDITARFDVGALSSYISCHQYFLRQGSLQSRDEIKMSKQHPKGEGHMMQKSKSKRLPATFLPGFHDKGAVECMRYNTLGKTGLEVSLIGLGGSPFGSVFHPMSLEMGSKVVRKALQSGINYIDTSPYYGNRKSETMLGKILKDIPREAYYIATKVGRYKPNVEEMFDFSAEKTLSSVDESLRLLGLDYADIIQVHDIEFAPNLDVVLKECLPALECVKKAGKARFIGITGFPLDMYRNILERSTVPIDVALSYCHLTLHDTSLLDLIPYLKEKGLGIINASPISMGLLTHRGPPDWHPAPAAIKEACREAALYCQSLGVDISKLAMHYTLSQNATDLTLVGMDTEEIVRSNLEIALGTLTELEKETLDHILKRFFEPLKNKSWEGIEVKNYRAKLKDVEGACH